MARKRSARRGHRGQGGQARTDEAGAIEARPRTHGRRRLGEAPIRHAIGALPSITPIGMAALQPGASASFSVVEQGGKFGARIDDVFLPDLAARKRFAAARVPKLVDIALDDVLSLQPSRLAKRIEGAQVIVVRSQEIDHAGEAGFTFQARQVMDNVIDNLARAIRKLAAAGVEQSVVSADLGCDREFGGALNVFVRQQVLKSHNPRSVALLCE